MPEVKSILWAPWRGVYVTSGKAKESACIFCDKAAGSDDENLILYRGALVYIIMNLYPYNNGHIMLVPFRHVADICDMTYDESLEMAVLTKKAATALRQTLHCQGMNIGYNIGEAAGAGVAGHIHQHIVPRWNGDTNFMPIIAETKVISEHMQSTYHKLKEAINKL